MSVTPVMHSGRVELLGPDQLEIQVVCVCNCAGGGHSDSMFVTDCMYMHVRVCACVCHCEEEEEDFYKPRPANKTDHVPIMAMMSYVHKTQTVYNVLQDPQMVLLSEKRAWA